MTAVGHPDSNIAVYARHNSYSNTITDATKTVENFWQIISANASLSSTVCQILNFRGHLPPC